MQKLLPLHWDNQKYYYDEEVIATDCGSGNVPAAERGLHEYSCG